MQTLTCELKDNDEEREDRRTVRVTVLYENGFLEIRPEGYGEHAAAEGYGAPVVLEVYGGELRAVVFGDINQEDPTHVIGLEGARENRRAGE